jgi:hypothetical protein
MRARFLVLGAAIAAANCKGDSTAPETVVTANVLNRLDVSTTLTAGGTNYGSLSPGSSIVLTLSPGTTVLTWTPVKRQYSNGSPIPDDLGGGSLSIGQNLGILDITNIVNGDAYITPVTSFSFAMFQSGDTVSYQVVQPGATRCIGWQTQLAVARWGYYRIDAGTTFRIYRGPSCTGTFAAWTYGQLSTFDVGSGVVRLSITQSP